METKNSVPRILLVVPFTKPDYSGSGINAFNFARFLNRAGYTASILTFNRNLRLKAKETSENVTIHRITYFNRNLVLKVLSLLIILPAYMKHIIRSDLLIIYGAHIIGYQFLIQFSRFMGRKTVFRSLLLGADDMITMAGKKSGISRKLSLRLLRKIDLYFAINDVFAQAYQEQFGRNDNILVCPQGVDVSYFKPPVKDTWFKFKREKGIEDDSFVILSVGFLVNRKGYSGVFRVLQQLDFDFRYIIAGEYDFGREHFMRRYAPQASWIRKEGMEILGDRLKLAGPVDSIKDYYHMTDMVLINSLSEGLSNTMLEAMACGKVVLVKDIPGIRYLVTHLETGMIFQNEEEMYALISRLKKEPDLRERIGKNAVAHIHSFASFEQTWAKLRNRLINS